MTTIERLVSDGLRRRLLALRRDLHRHPELSFREERTATRLHEELAVIDPAQLERVAGTGLLARVKGEDGGVPAVVIRGDIDALPIQEATGLPYASQNPGVMHACGHDVHAAWAVGAAHLLVERPARGDVLILLQPAEETGEGARAVLETGALEGCAAIFGAHVDRRFPVGQVVAQAGSLAAAADTSTIEVRGRGAHGARPHEGRDPIVGTGALIAALQTIVSRRLAPGTPGVVSVGMVRAGTAPNVIPESAELQGTIRSMDPETRTLLHEEVRRIAEATAAAHGLDARVEPHPGPPPLINEARAVEWAREATVTLLGPGAVARLESPNMGGEDFAYYLERMSGCFLRVGAREQGGAIIPAHSPGFYAADESIFVGAAVLAETARLASASLMT